MKRSPEYRHLILATELTRMNKGYCCVAAWDLTEGRMVRPLTSNGSYWKLDSDRDVFRPGNFLVCHPAKEHTGSYPHRTENLLLKDRPTIACEFGDVEQYRFLWPHCFSSIREGFGHRLSEDRFIVAETKCSSLIGVKAPRRSLKFHEDQRFRLRLRFEDSDGLHYDLPVTCDELTGMFGTRGGDDVDRWFGVAEANEWLSADSPDQQLILRIGLARAWAGPDGNWDPMRCYVQLNGIICPDNYYSIFAG